MFSPKPFGAGPVLLLFQVLFPADFHCRDRRMERAFSRDSGKLNTDSLSRAGCSLGQKIVSRIRKNAVVSLCGRKR